MLYNNYTANAPKVSQIGLGAWQLGESKAWSTMSDKEANELVQKALELGINFFDTAPNYGSGSSEMRLGKALKLSDRSKIVINTKFGHTVKGASDYSTKSIRSSIEGSLKRLQTDYIDSVLIHNPPFELLDGSKNDQYEELEHLIEEGKIRAYGASLDTFDEMDLFLDSTNGKVIEAFFNILHQDTARAFQKAKDKQVSIIAKIPLDSGWLSGKYTAESTFDDIRKRWTQKDKETRTELVEKVKAIIDRSSISQTALSFCMAFDAVSTVIPGSKNIDQLIKNVESTHKPLSDVLISELEAFYAEEVAHLNLPW